MEHVKRTPVIILLCLLSFFSCKPTDIISPKEHNALELEAAINAMPEFHLYKHEVSEAREALVLKLKNLDKKDAKWVSFMHEKYPTIETFSTKAETLELSTYKELTGLDLLQGNQNLNTYFKTFIEKLNGSAGYNSEDLVSIIFPDTQKESIEKFFPSCSTYCTYEAGRHQRRVYSQCILSISNGPSAESTCVQKAELAFQFYLAKCIKNCTGF